MSELKPCPFCDYDHPFESQQVGGKCIACSGCGARGGFRKTWKGAQIAWNTRTDDKRIEELEAEDIKSKHDIEMLHDSVNKLQAQVDLLETTKDAWRSNPDQSARECIQDVESILEAAIKAAD